MSSRICPVCSLPSAPNATTDLRCGPCHNFGITGFSKYGSALLQVSFNTWIDDQIEALKKANNLDSYRFWLRALRMAHDRKVNDL